MMLGGSIMAGAAHGQDRFDISGRRPVANGPTYAQIVETIFARVFPERLEYKGVGIRRDNVIAERVETNGRGGYWLSVRARYSGNILGVGVAERARVHYDNGGIRVDLGGMRGLLNTRALGEWIAGRLPRTIDNGGGGNNGGGNTGGGGNAQARPTFWPAAQDSGMVRIRNVGTGRYLEHVNSGVPTMEGNMSAINGDHCRWRWVKRGQGFSLQNVKTGMYLDIHGSSSAPMMERRQNGAGTIWIPEARGNSRFALKNLHSGRFLGGHYNGRLSMIAGPANDADLWEYR